MDPISNGSANGYARRTGPGAAGARRRGSDDRAILEQVSLYAVPARRRRAKRRFSDSTKEHDRNGQSCAHHAIFRPMRLHIALDAALVEEIDRRAGPRRRSAFIGELVQRGLDDERRWDDIEAALGGLSDSGHEWDDDPAAWVRRQRSADPRRTG